MRYFIELAYNGKPYHGWQRQPNAISVQEMVEEALSLMLKRKITIVGAGRTDTGVHARQIFAHFDAELTDKESLLVRLNSYLPKDIVIHAIFDVRDEAHARFDAVERSYEYLITTSKDPFLSDLTFFF